jgi:hypothetical protein
MRNATAFYVLALVCLVATPGQAQSNHPGYFAIDELGFFSSDQIEVDIDLNEAMAKIVAGAADDSEFAELMSQINRIRVLTGSFVNSDLEAMRSQLEHAADRLESEGWSRAVKVQDDDGEEVRMYLKQDGSLINGMTVMVLDHDEAVLVNIAGSIDPATLGKLLRGMSIPVNLQEIIEEAQKQG